MKTISGCSQLEVSSGIFLHTFTVVERTSDWATGTVTVDNTSAGSQHIEPWEAVRDESRLGWRVTGGSRTNTYPSVGRMKRRKCFSLDYAVNESIKRAIVRLLNASTVAVAPAPDTPALGPTVSEADEESVPYMDVELDADEREKGPDPKEIDQRVDSAINRILALQVARNGKSMSSDSQLPASETVVTPIPMGAKANGEAQPHLALPAETHATDVPVPAESSTPDIPIPTQEPGSALLPAAVVDCLQEQNQSAQKPLKHRCSTQGGVAHFRSRLPKQYRQANTARYVRLERKLLAERERMQSRLHVVNQIFTLLEQLEPLLKL